MSEKPRINPVNEANPAEPHIDTNTPDPIAVYVTEARSNRTDIHTVTAQSIADQFAAARKARHDRWAGHYGEQPQQSPIRTIKEKLIDLFDPNNESVNRTAELFASARKVRHEKWSKRYHSSQNNSETPLNQK